MLNVSIDEQELRNLVNEKIEEKIRKIESDLVFWDSNELTKRTCMSWNFIQDKFFFDKRFPKFKVGNKWYFPADETKKFLLQWLSEQRL